MLTLNYIPHLLIQNALRPISMSAYVTWGYEMTQLAFPHF